MEQGDFSMRRWTKGLLIAVALIVPLAVLAGTFRPYRVATRSNEPAYSQGDLIWVNRSAYDLTFPFTYARIVPHSDPGRGDMILFKAPGREGTVYFKRVVGVPGDRVEFRGNCLLVNGRYKDYVHNDPEDPNDYSFGPVFVEPGQYFVLGEDPGNSWDSRNFGSISRDRILGKVMGTSKHSQQG
jgi:signal peptidase I